VLTTYRAQNEQAMAHAAIGFAKASMRRRMMACTTSIGPGATNLVTAAALAHVNRLPVLFLPGDVFVTRAPDPVLQQIEDFQDGTVSANDCLRPVSRYFDRIVHPAQLLTALPRAIDVLTDPALCGPATLACRRTCRRWRTTIRPISSRRRSFDSPFLRRSRPTWTRRSRCCKRRRDR
jgi:Acetolactate synthase